MKDAAAGAAPSARPTNVSRTTFHVASGVVSLALLRLAPERWWLVAISGSIAASGYAMEIARRRSDAVNARLMRLLDEVGAQVFVTTTHPELIRVAHHRVDYRVEAGRIELQGS